MDYRKEIDGLRAIAIIPVVLFHSGLPFFKSGYIGVDIFFVISGYLITQVIFPEMQNKTFKFSWFYENRIRRLFPALFFLIAVTSICSLFLLDPLQLKDFSYSVFSSLFFYSNFFFWKEIDYFESNSELMPLLHTWSLSIEEQFYIFFPLVLILLIKYLQKYTLIMIIFFCLTSLGLWIYGNAFYQTATFYMPITRAWELLAGASLAIYVLKYGHCKERYLSTLGILLIFTSFYLLSFEYQFKHLLVVLPVVGTLLVLSSKNHTKFLTAFLQNKILVFVGLISYSLYLFHQPIFAFAKIYFIDLSLLQVLIAIICALFLSYFSWRYVERLFRKRFNSKINFLNTLLVLSLPMLLSISIAIYSIKTDGNKVNFFNNLSIEDAKTYSLLEEIKIENENDTFITNDDCIISSDTLTKDLKTQILQCAERFDDGVLFFGDSHSKDIFNSYQYLKKSEFIIGINANFCQAHISIKKCFFEDLSKFLSEFPNIFKKIYFHQAGYFFLSHNNKKFNDKHFLEHLELQDDITEFDVSQERINKLKDNLKIFPEDLILLGPKIEPHIQDKYIRKNSCGYKYSLRKKLEDAFKSLDKSFARTFKNRNYISLQEKINFSVELDFINCDNLYWSDGDHWSSAGEKKFSSSLESL